ncbi:MAG: Zn-ribbon domain-containing OB-fold protein [Thermoplasmatales archaeon]|nr:Zn-ribbon domain-containing OB-fold protein [Candidatus Thermoplasmatota archaeon]MCL6002731.1 Zn-ribbon domain-containing OB-fold protein [Candidatus Thermoplasmatota archaeon]MDA8054722.1 Zn-ribbon domain-containing OB-fold protein [Thermoplasmatales archaeon]
MTEVYSIDPLIINTPYEITYKHSYGKTTKFFTSLSSGKLTATRCDHCKKTFLPPRSDCPYCLAETRWVEISGKGTIHTFSTLYFSGERFLKDLPFQLVYVDLEGVDTLFLTRLKTKDMKKVKVGMKIKMKISREPEWRSSDVWAEPDE